MDEFKKKLFYRQFLLAGGLLVAFGAIALSWNFIKPVTATEHMQGFISGFQMGFIVALLGILIFVTVKNAAALRSPDKLKKFYIAETDERAAFIRQKAGSAGMNIIMYALALGTIVAGNINQTVFFALLGACGFVALVRAFFKLYYRNKY